MKAKILLLLTMFCIGAQAENYNYNTLITKDYDFMRDKVQAKIKKAKSLANESGEPGPNDAEAVENLRESLKLVFSRPDSDNMIAKLTPDIRRALMGFNAYEDTISSLVVEASENLKNKNATPSQRATAVFVLENILGEIQVEAAKNVDLRNVIQKLADAKLDVPDEVNRNRRMGAMIGPFDPSDQAKKILKEYKKTEENRVKDEEKKKKEEEKKSADKK